MGKIYVHFWARRKPYSTDPATSSIQVLIKDWKSVWYQTDLHHWRFIWLFLLRLEVGLCFSKSDRLPPKMAEIRLILRLNVIMEANLIIRLVSDLIIRWVSNLNIRQAADLIIRYHGGWLVFVVYIHYTFKIKDVYFSDASSN